MGIVATPKNYWIAPNAISISRNAMGEPNRIQASTASGAVILCYIEGVSPDPSSAPSIVNGDGLEFDSGHNYRRWPLTIFPTYFNSNEKKYIYVAIPKSSKIGTTATVVFPSEILDIYGKNNDNEQVGSTDYFYIWLQGILSSSGEEGTTPRQWEQPIEWGELKTDSSIQAYKDVDWWGQMITPDGHVRGPLVGDIDYIKFSNGVCLGIAPEDNTLRVFMQDRPAGSSSSSSSSSSGDEESIPGDLAHFYTTGGNSALGFSPIGTSPLGLNEPLLSINTSGLGAPGASQDGMAIVWDKTLNSGQGGWKYGAAGGGDYLPLSGGTLTGNLRLKNSDDYGLGIYFGDSEYCYLKEASDDILTIYGRYGINLNTVSGYTAKLNGKDIATQYWVSQQGFLTSHQPFTMLSSSRTTQMYITIGSTTKTLSTVYSGALFVDSPLDTGHILEFYSGQPVVGSSAGNAYRGSSNDYSLWSYPDGGTGEATSEGVTKANVMNIRLYWSSSYWHDLFVSPNQKHLWHRYVNNGTAYAWRKILDNGDCYVDNSGFGWIGGNKITKAVDTETLGGLSSSNFMRNYNESANVDLNTLTGSGAHRLSTGAQNRPTGASNDDYAQVLSVIGGGDTIAQFFFPYGRTTAYLRNGNPLNQNSGSWKAWREIAFTDGSVASANTLSTTRKIWGRSFNGSEDVSGTMEEVTAIEFIGTSGSSPNGGYIDFHYNRSQLDYTSRIIENTNGGLSINNAAFIFKSDKPASDSDFPGGGLTTTTDWGSYSFRNVFTNNSLFYNTLFLRGNLYMRCNQGIRIKNTNGDDVTALSMEGYETGNYLILGAGAHLVSGITTTIRGNVINFQIANGAGSTLVGHFANSGDFYIDAAGKSLLMNDGTTARNMMGINIPATHFHLCYGSVNADWQTRIYGGGGDDKGIRFYHGNTLAAAVEGGDHSLVAYYHIKLTTNNQSLYTRDTTNNPIETIKMSSSNVLYFGSGNTTHDHETRMYGGATDGINFYVGSNNIAGIQSKTVNNVLLKGLRIGDGVLMWDSTNNALKVIKSDGSAAHLYATGGVSALGFTPTINNMEAFSFGNLSVTSLLTATSLTAGNMTDSTKAGFSLSGTDIKIKAGSGGKLEVGAMRSTAGAGYWHISVDGEAHFRKVYLDSTRYLYIKNPAAGVYVLMYNDGQSDHEIKLS